MSFVTKQSPSEIQPLLPHKTQFNKRLQDIGNTPLYPVKSISLNDNKVYAKCEFMNPTGSHKDRTFHHMICSLEKDGIIHPGMTLVDCSTGNGGAALAWIGREKGYHIKIFMPEGMTDERIQQIRELGAEIVETDSQLFLEGAVAAAKNYVFQSRSTDHYFLDQGSNTLNKEAWLQCGEEIVAQLNENKIEPDYFVCSIGTGGTFSGIAKVLKTYFPGIRTIGIEVDRSAPLYRKRNGEVFKHQPHNLMGLGAGVLSNNTDELLIDKVVLVEGNRSWDRMKQFIDKEGLGIGPTCGGNLLICEELATQVTGKNIVTLFFDSSWKYKSRWSGIYQAYS